MKTMITIITKEAVTENSLNDIIEYATSINMVVAQLSDHMVIVRDKDLYNPANADKWYSVSINSLYDYLMDIAVAA